VLKTVSFKWSVIDEIHRRLAFSFSYLYHFTISWWIHWRISARKRL